MNTTQVIAMCNTVILANKGISMEEEIILDRLPKIDSKNLSELDAVLVAKRRIQAVLGRKNITPRDLKKGVLRSIKY